MKRPILTLVLCAAFISTFVQVPDSHSQPTQAGYVGANACDCCHEDLVKGWKTTRHAKAFETLKKKSQESLPNCQKCHVTGFDKAGGFVDLELTPELAGVQCESCHGAAAAHAAGPDKRKPLIAIPDESTCRECHTKGQDPKFDYNTKRKLVHGDSRKGEK